MKARSKLSVAVTVALSLFCLLAGGALAIAVGEGRGQTTLTLHRLTAKGPRVEHIRAPDSATAYERLLTGTSPGGFPALRERLARYRPLLRAQLDAKSGDRTSAQSHLRRYLARRPGDLITLWRLIELTSADKDHPAVIEASDRLLSHRPGFGPALLRRAQARHIAGDRLGSLSDFIRALERPLAADDFAAAAAALLQILVDAGEMETARIYAVQLKDSIPAARSSAILAYAAHALGEHEEAAAFFRQAVQEEPSPALTLALARSLSLTEDKKEIGRAHV